MALSVTPADLTFLGQDLARPECVVVTARGDVFASDRRGGIARVHADRTPELILGRGVAEFLPNGLALLLDRSFMIANLGPSGGVWRMLPDGELVPELLEVDGMSLPPTNFANAEHTTGALRLWVSVSTRKVPREQAMRSDVADGYIVLKDARGARIVADGLGFTNENKLDPSGLQARAQRLPPAGEGRGRRGAVETGEVLLVGAHRLGVLPAAALRQGGVHQLHVVGLQRHADEARRLAATGHPPQEPAGPLHPHPRQAAYLGHDHPRRGHGAERP
jgi:hypothetical protein